MLNMNYHKNFTVRYKYFILGNFIRDTGYQMSNPIFQLIKNKYRR